MTPKDLLVIENPINLNSIMLVFAALCIIFAIFFLVGMILDKKRMKCCRKIKDLIEEGHQRKLISRHFSKK